MCLIDKKKYRWAKEDIPIWKVVLIRKDGYYSPFISDNKLMKVNEVANEKPFSILKTFIKNFIDSNHCHEFEEGFFHAFTCKDEAELLAANINLRYKDGLFGVISGYIPKNTRYAISIHNNNHICARKMILNITPCLCLLIILFVVVK